MDEKTEKWLKEAKEISATIELPVVIEKKSNKDKSEKVKDNVTG